ncbi:unnamed protein product [Effrenium voratum]|uniref:Uncharacterized protein n=1 Tax=Effrenium voratum TaxID=2562239 RepID=A0AA36HL03_9DINO|nr:unnamed protein product [Effrenium voratum]
MFTAAPREILVRHRLLGGMRKILKMKTHEQIMHAIEETWSSSEKPDMERDLQGMLPFYPVGLLPSEPGDAGVKEVQSEKDWSAPSLQSESQQVGDAHRKQEVSKETQGIIRCAQSLLDKAHGAAKQMDGQEAKAAIGVMAATMLKELLQVVQNSEAQDCLEQLEALNIRRAAQPMPVVVGGGLFAGLCTLQGELARRLLQGALQDSQSGRAGQVPAGDALQQLDRGLSSLQAEVAILKQMGADSARVGFETPPRRQGASDTLTGRVLGSPQPRWLQGLDYAAQGRVAACGSRAEALQVLEEAAEPEFSGQAPEEPKEASYEQIAAALALLQQAKDRVAKLEAQRNDAWKRHQEEVAALRASLEKQRRESLQRLLLRLAPPGFRKPCPGSLASPVPTPRRARKAAQVVEQGRPEPVTQAASLGDSSG